MSGWHSWISIRLLNQWWSIVNSIPTGGNFIFCWNLLKLLDVNFIQKCQICVICENLDLVCGEMCTITKKVVYFPVRCTKECGSNRKNTKNLEMRLIIILHMKWHLFCADYFLRRTLRSTLYLGLMLQSPYTLKLMSRNFDWCNKLW